MKIFNHLFLGIVEDNNAISNISRALQNGRVTQTGYNAAVGKAKFLRALAYLKLVQALGRGAIAHRERRKHHRARLYQ